MKDEKQDNRKKLLIAITSGAVNLMCRSVYPHFKDCFTYIAIDRHEGLALYLSNSDFTNDKLEFTSFASFSEIEERLLTYIGGFEEIILLSCLGRPVNAELTIKIVKFFFSKGQKVALVAAIPFVFEGKNRINEALYIIKKLRVLPISLRLSVGQKLLEGCDLASTPFELIFKKVGEDVVAQLEDIVYKVNEVEIQNHYLDELIEYVEAFRDLADSREQSMRRYVEDFGYGNKAPKINPSNSNDEFLNDSTDIGRFKYRYMTPPVGSFESCDEKLYELSSEYLKLYRVGLEYYNKGQYNWAINNFMPLAKRKDKIAQFLVGISLLKLGQEKSAHTWFKRAACQGYTVAKFFAGYLYVYCNYMPHQYVKALKYFQDAAEDGDSDAQFMTGWLYEVGWGVKKDVKEARKWYQMAVEKEHPLAFQKQSKLFKCKFRQRKRHNMIEKKIDIKDLESMPWILIIFFQVIDLILIISYFIGWNLASFIIINIGMFFLFFSLDNKKKKASFRNMEFYDKIIGLE